MWKYSTHLLAVSAASNPRWRAACVSTSFVYPPSMPAAESLFQDGNVIPESADSAAGIEGTSSYTADRENHAARQQVFDAAGNGEQVCRVFLYLGGECNYQWMPQAS
jgi:hypothetical protein